jgi:hypothetical protein
MPEKEGAEEKSTKSVVSKRQKQMMNKEEYTIEMVRKIKKIINPKAVFPPVAQNKVKGEIVKGDDLKIDNKNPVKKKLQKNNLDEEGYDIARDMGRVRPSKDKKDATTMPPSKEMEKTRKVVKGPSALERVKKKYKGQIMKVEELDLTKVAEAFGGYIIEKDERETPMIKRVRERIKDLDATQPDYEDQVNRIIYGNNNTMNKGRNANTGGNGSDFSSTSEKTGNMKGGGNKLFKNPDEKEVEKIKPQDKKKKVEITYGKYDTRKNKVTGDVEPEPEKIKKPIRDRNRILQRVRVAARKTKRPVQRLVKPVGKLAARNPFAAAIVGTDLLDRAGRAIPKPSLPKMDVGVVGRRTAG